MGWVGRVVLGGCVCFLQGGKLVHLHFEFHTYSCHSVLFRAIFPAEVVVSGCRAKDTSNTHLRSGVSWGYTCHFHNHAVD